MKNEKEDNKEIWVKKLVTGLCELYNILSLEKLSYAEELTN